MKRLNKRIAVLESRQPNDTGQTVDIKKLSARAQADIRASICDGQYNYALMTKATLREIVGIAKHDNDL